MRENQSFSIVKQDSYRIEDLKKKLESLKRESYPKQIIDRNESKYLDILQSPSPLNSTSSKAALNSFLSNRKSPFLDKTLINSIQQRNEQI